MVDIPRAQPLPALGTIQPLGIGAGLATGLEQGQKMNYLASQTKALDIQNQYAPAAAKLAADAQAAKIKKEKIDSALSFLGAVGEKVKFFTPESQKIAIANGMNAIADAAPEWGIQKTDPSNIPDEGVDLVKQYGILHKARMDGSISEGEFQTDGQQILMKMTQYQRDMMKDSASVLGAPSFEAGQTPTGAPASFNTKTGMTTSPTGQPTPGVGFIPAATAASTQAENQRKAIDENEKYKTSVTPFVNAHNNFVQMQKIANQAEKAGTSVDPWSFINAYVHTVDPSYNGVLTAQTYKDLRIAGSPIVSMIPGGETYLTSSKLDPNDAMRMLQIAKAQDRIYSKTASDYMDMTKRHIQSLGGDPAIVKDLLTQAPITKQLKSGRTAISDDGGLTWRPQ